VVGEAVRELPEQPEPPVHLMQQGKPAVRGDVLGLKARHQLPAADPLKFHLLRATVCFHRVGPSDALKCLRTLQLSVGPHPVIPHPVIDPG